MKLFAIFLLVAGLLLGASLAMGASPVVEAALACKVELNCPYFGKVFVLDRRVSKAVRLQFAKVSMSPPDWMDSGVEAPVLPVVLDGRLRLLGHVCEPHNCMNGIWLLFEPQSGRLVGLWNLEDKYWLGAPNARERKLLTDLDTEGTAPYLQYRDLKKSLPLHLGAKPNPPLNRTRNGMPPAGLMSFWPFGVLPSRAG